MGRILRFDDHRVSRFDAPVLRDSTNIDYHDAESLRAELRRCQGRLTDAIAQLADAHAALTVAEAHRASMEGGVA